MPALPPGARAPGRCLFRRTGCAWPAWPGCCPGLPWPTLAWMGIEGGVAIVAAVAAGSVARARHSQAADRRPARFLRDRWGGNPESPVRLPGNSSVRRAGRQYVVGRLVARWRGRAWHRGLGGSRGTAGVGREVVRLRMPAGGAVLIFKRPEPLTPACEATYSRVLSASTWPGSCPWVAVRYRCRPLVMTLMTGPLTGGPHAGPWFAGR